MKPSHEEHARIVVERDGDAEYVQRHRSSEGYRYDLTPQLSEGLTGQLDRFREVRP